MCAGIKQSTPDNGTYGSHNVTMTTGPGANGDMGDMGDTGDMVVDPDTALRTHRSASLPGLPDELIQQIARHLDPKSAANLALTSKDMFQALPGAVHAGALQKKAQDCRSLADIESVLNGLTRHFADAGAGAMSQAQADHIWRTLVLRLPTLDHAGQIAAFDSCVNALRDQALQHRLPQAVSRWLAWVPRLARLCGRSQDHDCLSAAMQSLPGVGMSSPMLAELAAAACVTPASPAEQLRRHDFLKDQLASGRSGPDDACASTCVQLLSDMAAPPDPEDSPGLRASRSFLAQYTALVRQEWHENIRLAHMRGMISGLFSRLPEPLVDAATASMLDQNHDFSDWRHCEDVLEDLVRELGRRCAADRNLPLYTRRLRTLLAHATSRLSPMQQVPLRPVLEQHLQEILNAPTEYQQEHVHDYLRLLCDFRDGMSVLYNLRSANLLRFENLPPDLKQRLDKLQQRWERTW